MSLPRQPVCPQYRDRLVAVAGGEARDRAIDAHVAACVGCRAFLARTQRHVLALTNLTRTSPPRELDGRVVAATQAGFRQDRAVSALSLLTPANMPREAEFALWSTSAGASASRAPSALDHLVDASLRGPGHGVGERISAHLTRREAPAALEQRVASAYERGRRERASAERRLLWVGATALFLALLVASSLFVADRRDVHAAGADVVASTTNSPAQPANGPRIVIERVTSPSDLDPLLSGVFAGLVGGAPDAVRLTGGKL